MSTGRPRSVRSLECTHRRATLLSISECGGVHASDGGGLHEAGEQRPEAEPPSPETELGLLGFELEPAGDMSGSASLLQQPNCSTGTGTAPGLRWLESPLSARCEGVTEEAMRGLMVAWKGKRASAGFVE